MDSIATAVRRIPAASRETVGPADPDSRLVEVDMVRGFALFGVLLVNMYGFGADSIAWSSLPDRLAYTAMHVLFESKFWTLFSLLFGFGFALLLGRTEARGTSVLQLYLRRLAVLFVLGAVHVLLNDGDILMLYAELGLVLLLVRRLPTRGLLGLAAALILVFPFVRLTRVESTEPGRVRSNEVARARAQLERSQRSDVYAVGSFSEVVAENATAIPAKPLEDIDTPESGLAVFAMFLVGYAVGRSGRLRDIAGNAGAISRLRAWGLGIGIAAMAVEQSLVHTARYEVFRPSRAGPGPQLAGDLLFAFGTTSLALGYGAALILAAQTPRGRALLDPLAAVGRMALTVYLAQTLMFTTLFYGYGLGRAYRLGPVAVTGWAIAFFAVQVVACQWWSRRFQFGPAEWLWRSLTYLRWQPMRQPSPTTR